MPDIAIEQALYGNAETGGYRFVSRSPGFLDAWLPLAERLCTGFGERPPGVACPGAVFAQPLGTRHVAVVQVADQGSDDAGRPGALGFRLLVVPREDYGLWLGDPFALADRFPPPWSARGDLPTLLFPREPPSRRTVEQVRQVLKNGDSATLLGGVQALIDAGRIVFQRPAPAPDLLRQLWLLMPQSSRAEIWPATFAFGNDLRFDVLVTPRVDPARFPDYLTEEQAGDYPQGRYELDVQIAAESGDQRALDALFTRRSSRQTLKLAVILLVVVAVVALAARILQPPPGSRNRTHASASSARHDEQSGISAAPALLDRYPPLTVEMRQRLTEALRSLLQQLEPKIALLAVSVEELLLTLQERLLTLARSDAKRIEVLRRLERLGEPGDAERHLRLLAWALGIERHDDPRLNPVELVELLQRKLGVQPHER
ncbi:MAG: hypothetical protein JNM56_26160 [Planctomycetia bacterium]|nr:hypothetical protein [Planctomycetia bacterium]